jgi:two-component system cell cycle sensor histidine kinase/response regulator CckA
MGDVPMTTAAKLTSDPAASILIVEDERVFAMDLQEMLRECGYDAFAIASSADDALARVAQRRPNLVMMDIRIKGSRDGVETAALLRQRYDVPIIFVTAHADEATLARVKATGPYGYLVKPIRASELRGAVEVSLLRHASELALRERERWFATTVDAVADAVMTTDAAGRCTFLNAAARRLFGIAPEQAIDRPASDVLRLPGADEDPVSRALRERAVLTLPHATLSTAAGARTLGLTVTPTLQDGELRGLVVVLRETSEVGPSPEPALSIEQLELADRMTTLGRLAGGLAHELSNPLAALSSNIDFIGTEVDDLNQQLMAAGTGNPAQLESLTSLKEAQLELERGLGVVRRIAADLHGLSGSAPEADRADLRSAIDWAARAVVHELRPRARLIHPPLPALPPVRLTPSRLAQLLVNLLLNAAQAIEPGTPDNHEVRIEARLLEPNWLQLEIADTGQGVPETLRRRMFEPFVSSRPPAAALGLGLAIARGIVAAVGGELHFESRPGGGSLFRARLPAADSGT